MTMYNDASLPFIKMHGLGNDFIVIDCRQGLAMPPQSAMPALADRNIGIGCDQFVILENAPHVDASLRFFNADGSESGACGNATRCIGYLLMEASGEERCIMRIGERRVLATRDKKKNPRLISVDMGAPSFDPKDIPLSEECDALALRFDEFDLPDGGAVSVGNPHLVFFLDDLGAVDLTRIGSRLEKHPLFPERTNVHIATKLSGNAIMMRTWERGTGLTQACGTGACAVFALGMKRDICNGDEDVTIHMPGGKVSLRYDGRGNLLMRGPAASVFTGVVNLNALTPEGA